MLLLTAQPDVAVALEQVDAVMAQTALFGIFRAPDAVGVLRFRQITKIGLITCQNTWLLQEGPTRTTWLPSGDGKEEILCSNLTSNLPLPPTVPIDTKRRKGEVYD